MVETVRRRAEAIGSELEATEYEVLRQPNAQEDRAISCEDVSPTLRQAWPRE